MTHEPLAADGGIGPEARAWAVEDLIARADALPDMFERTGGCLYGDEERRLAMLAARPDTVGFVAGARLALLGLWREIPDRVARERAAR